MLVGSFFKMLPIQSQNISSAHPYILHVSKTWTQKVNWDKNVFYFIILCSLWSTCPRRSSNEGEKNIHLTQAPPFPTPLKNKVGKLKSNQTLDTSSRSERIRYCRYSIHNLVATPSGPLIHQSNPFRSTEVTSRYNLGIDLKCEYRCRTRQVPSPRQVHTHPFYYTHRMGTCQRQNWKDRGIFFNAHFYK
jgi:hypothetical protein